MTSDGKTIVDHENIQRSRLRVDAIFATGAGDHARHCARRVVAVLMQEQRAKALFCDGHHIASATAELVWRLSIGTAWAVRRLLTQPRLMRGFLWAFRPWRP
jgi:hypothetical protein